jgi:hypothetical protein
MVIATLRDDELGSSGRRWLAELERRPRVQRLRVAPLTAAQIGEVVADLVTAETSADARAAVITAAGGNPLYARELASAGPGVMPASITDAVLAKAADLEPAARALIDQVSVADGGMSHDLLAATVTLSEARMLGAARAAVNSSLLVMDGDGYAFGHTLIRQVIYGQILPGERRLLHRRLAAALAGRPGSDPGLLGDLVGSCRRRRLRAESGPAGVPEHSGTGHLCADRSRAGSGTCWISVVGFC